MNKEDVRRILGILAKKRPIFNDEKDFQYSLGNEIKHAIPDSVLFLEGRPLRIQADIKYDICFSTKDTEVFFELKYKPARLSAILNSKEFELKNQSAQDLWSYDFFYDIWKLEQVVRLEMSTGFAIFLTNDSLYWRGAKESSAYYPFRLEDQRTIHRRKSYSWKKQKEKKGKMRQKDIVLNQDYTLSWQEYALIKEGVPIGNSQFRYLLLEITGS